MSNSPTSQLGSLTSKITDTLKSKASTQTESSRTSGIGQPTPHLPSARNEAPGNSGKSGAVARPTVGRAKLNAVERNDATLKQSVMELAAGSKMDEEWSHGVAGPYGWDGHLVSFHLDPPPANAAAICELIERACQPAQRKDVAVRLTMLAEALPSQGDASRVESWLRLVWESIEDFPADVIEQAAKDWAKREKWRPGPAELREECFRVGGRRMAMKRLCERLRAV